MELNELLLRDDVRSLLKVTVVLLGSLLFWMRLYRRAIAEAAADAELETLKRAPLRIVTEQDFDDAAATMDEDERLAVQRRSEGLGWFDADEDFQRETA